VGAGAVRADLLLAGLSAARVRHWIHEQHRTLDDLTQQLAAAALTQQPPDA
jgi:hypothetical protein